LKQKIESSEKISESSSSESSKVAP
jgi:hypothetical protein